MSKMYEKKAMKIAKNCHTLLENFFNSEVNLKKAKAIFFISLWRSRNFSQKICSFRLKHQLVMHFWKKIADEAARKG